MAKANKSEILFHRGQTTDMEDIWDDSVLIEAYERAANLAYDAVHQVLRSNGEFSADELRNSSIDLNKYRQRDDSFTGNSLSGDETSAKKKGRRKRRSNRKKWQVGDKCLSKYSEDGQWYEAMIISMDRSHNQCAVRYDGYENEEVVNLGMLQKCPETSMDEEESALSEKEGVDEMEDGSEINKQLDQRRAPTQIPLLPPPIPPHLLRHHNDAPQEDEAMAAMLMSWYTNGYHTGYYQAMRDMKLKK